METLARAYGCPSCGASVDEHARRCTFCRAPVATVRCAVCFHMNVAEAIHCSGCGRDLGLEPVGEAAQIGCPHCATPLVGFPAGAGRVYDCEACGGQFVEHAAFRDLVERHDHPTPVGPPASARFVPPAPVKYIPCPACASLMNRKNFGATSGVVVDVCKRHGTWFDLGELPRVLAFIEGGGLERERRRHADEAAEERRKLLAAATSSAVHAHSASDVEDRAAISGGRGLGSLLLDILLR